MKKGTTWTDWHPRGLGQPPALWRLCAISFGRSSRRYPRREAGKRARSRSTVFVNQEARFGVCGFGTAAFPPRFATV
jgi:hypothetical protein